MRIFFIYLPRRLKQVYYISWRFTLILFYSRFLSVYSCICVSVSLSIYLCIYQYTHIYVCMCLCVCVCMWYIIFVVFIVITDVIFTVSLARHFLFCVNLSITTGDISTISVNISFYKHSIDSVSACYHFPMLWIWPRAERRSNQEHLALTGKHTLQVAVKYLTKLVFGRVACQREGWVPGRGGSAKTYIDKHCKQMLSMDQRKVAIQLYNTRMVCVCVCVCGVAMRVFVPLFALWAWLTKLWSIMTVVKHCRLLASAAGGTVLFDVNDDALLTC